MLNVGGRPERLVAFARARFEAALKMRIAAYSLFQADAKRQMKLLGDAEGPADAELLELRAFNETPSSQIVAHMPTDCAPWPGNMNVHLFEYPVRGAAARCPRVHADVHARARAVRTIERGISLARGDVERR